LEGTTKNKHDVLSFYIVRTLYICYYKLIRENKPMAKEERINLRVNSDIKENASKVASVYGFNLSSVINAFLTQIATTGSIPLNLERRRKHRKKEFPESSNIPQSHLPSLKSLPPIMALKFKKSIFTVPMQKGRPI